VNAADVPAGRLRELAAVLGASPAQDDSDLGIRGLAVGAAYSLARALQLGYRDPAGKKLAKEYRQQLAETAAAVADGQGVSGEWLATYYFNNALIRLAAARDRLDKLKQNRKRKPGVRDEVNIFKHEFGGFVEHPRSVNMASALEELSLLVGVIEPAVE